ncbi:hypothetical protein ACFWYW_04035 [Nonomuraea sp. NPDC059023]|uniref:hypothetical protein n=1 Tax=unclassified Nonomuraea TaxID=2593643 RepID=UPI0036CB80B7
MTDLDQRKAITAFFQAHSKGWKALARQKRWLVEGMVAIGGIRVLDRLRFDLVDCPCCIEEDERERRLSWMKAEYHRRRRNRR